MWGKAPASMTDGARGRRDLLARMRGDWRRNLFLLLFVLDLGVITLAVAAGFFARFAMAEASLDTVRSQGNLYLVVVPALILGWQASLLLNQAYNMEIIAIGTDEYRRVVRATFFTFGALAIVLVLLRWQVARGFLAVALPLGLVLLLIERLLVRRWVLARRRRAMLVDGVVVVGSPHEVRYVAEGIARNPAAGLVVRAVATDTTDAPTFELANGVVVPQAGAIADVVDAVHRYEASTIIVAGHNRINRKQLRELGWQLEDTTIRLALASRMTDVAGPRIHWHPIEGLPLMSVEMPRYSGVKYSLKRAFDLVIATGMVVLVAPILFAIAIAVRLDSPGPIFFRQTRVGVNGTLFKMTKFRSMAVDAEARLAGLERQNEGSGLLFKMKDDPRITRVGAFIRRYSLDELPQLFDVIAGGMSLVGPRPPLPREVEAYDHHVHRRLNVKPGITGPWQVGGRSNLSWQESVRKDLYYVENWSLSGDLVIMFKTLRAVLARDGAY